MILKHIMYIGVIFLAYMLYLKVISYLPETTPGLIVFYIGFIYGWFVFGGITNWFYFRK